MVTLMWNYLYKNGVNSVQVCHVTRWASILACSARYFICLRSIDVSDSFLLVTFSVFPWLSLCLCNNGSVVKMMNVIHALSAQ